ncbi:MAG: hypothetical protein MI976_03000 [Pseudomonadales bacterium]|nr:hypothetical protein [Pseudomonadales bacterium]
MIKNELQDVYITGTGIFLPNEPIENDQIYDFLGTPEDADDKEKSKGIKRLILSKNGIKRRHYALDREGNPTHLNSELARNAILAALDNGGLTLADLDQICLGSAVGDVLIPGLANMVHGELGGDTLGLVSTHGVCGSGITAMQSAWLSVRSGLYDTVIAGGSERISPALRGYRVSGTNPPEDKSRKDYFFEAEFLRYMLSDGAGAATVQNKPSTSNMSLRIDFIENRSYGGKYECCMCLGTLDPTQLKPGRSWIDFRDFSEAQRLGFLNVRQNFRKLNEHICGVVVEDLKRLIGQGLNLDDVDWFLPHISSFSFDQPLQDELKENGLDLPREKWWLSLAERGNMGGAGPFVTLHDFLESGLLKPGQKVLLLLPESSRFTMGWCLFTAIPPQ